jgi:hypothetical protein
MTATSFHELSADLDGLLHALDRSLTAPERPSPGLPASPAPAGGPAVLTGTFRLQAHFAASSASCSRLIDVIRSLRPIEGPAEATVPMPVPFLEPVPAPLPVRNRPAVAPLSVPDRILKRDYNYFDDLNADLAYLAKKQKKNAAEGSLISPY